jgi:hypothetical protein
VDFYVQTEEDGYLFQTARTAWRATGLTQPICESHRKPAWPEIADMDSEHVRTLVDKQNGGFVIYKSLGVARLFLI